MDQSKNADLLKSGISAIVSAFKTETIPYYIPKLAALTCKMKHGAEKKDFRCFTSIEN